MAVTDSNVIDAHTIHSQVERRLFVQTGSRTTNYLLAKRLER